MKNRKIFAICVCFVIVLSTLFGCNKKIYITTGLKQDEIFKLSGEPCRLAEVLLVLMTEKSRYEKDLGKDIWSYRVDDESKNLEEEIKSKVKSQMAELKTVELLAKNNKIQLSDTEKEKIASASKEFINLLSDETKKKLSLKENDVNSLYTSFYMADKVYDKLTGNVKPEISDEEARVIQIRYLYISKFATNESGEKVQLSQEEMEQKISRLNEASTLLSEGNDFLAVLAQYSEADTDEIYVSKGNVAEEISSAAFSLKSGEISKTVETEDGYYIILCIKDYIEDLTAENKIRMEEEYKKKVYNDTYIPFEAEQTFEFNDKVWNNIHFQDYKEVDISQLYEVYNKWMSQN